MQDINQHPAGKLIKPLRKRLIKFAYLEEAIVIAFIVGSLLLVLCLAASATPRNPVFSVPGGTTFTAPHDIAIAVPYNGEIRLTRDNSSPTTTSTLYTRPITIRWSETIKAIAVVGGSTSSVVTATYTLDSNKFPAPSAGGTAAPVINLQLPVGQ